MIIGLVGYIGSGKDTAAKYILEKYNYRKDSFANSLKDAVAAIFGWPRAMLEGDTEESRIWRDTVDQYWSVKLKIPNFTPRYALQFIGTDVLRGHFNDDLWFLTLEKRALDNGNRIVISDVRFPNELRFIKNQNGITIRVVRGTPPVWEKTAAAANRGDDLAFVEMASSFPGVHTSEWSLTGSPTSHTIVNDGDLNALYDEIDKVLATYSL